jgi:hypothetical protein
MATVNLAEAKSDPLTEDACLFQCLAMAWDTNIPFECVTVSL